MNMSDIRGGPLSPRIKPRTRIEDDSAIETDYHLSEVLGKGAFGVVWEATHTVNKQKYAIKMVHKDKPGSVAIQLLEREIQVLNHVDHRHIIQLIEVFETPKKVFMVLELCRGGELSDLLKERKSFTEDEVKIIMRQLAEALVYMHDKDMVHRDLKLENILLSKTGSSEPFNIKVTDFGLSFMKGLPGCDDLMSSRCGTLYYMAPEVLTNKHEYSKLCDVWSVGVIMYALLCGKMPFNGETAVQLEEHILSGTLKFQEPEWVDISDGAKELIQGMLTASTMERLTARQILEDPWITGENRKRIDPFMMLTDDSPSPSPSPQARTTSIVKPLLEPAKLEVKPMATKDQKSTGATRNMSHSSSTSKVTGPSGGRKVSTPLPSSQHKKTVTSSISTGRLSSSRTATGRSQSISGTAGKKQNSSGKT